jgi:hypothetical protein
VVNAAVSRATNFIVSLTPYGIFAIAAVTSGTLDLLALQRIQVYLLSYIAVSLLLSLWILPGLVAAVTPVPYRALLSVTRDALILLAAGRQPLAQRVQFMHLYESLYNPVTGELVLGPDREYRVGQVQLPPVEGSQVLAEIYGALAPRKERSS